MVLVTDFKDKLALITGATGGIGYATCLALAGLGCDIAVHYNSAAEKAQTLVAALREKGVKAECFQADLRSYDEVRRLHKEVVEKMGHPAILFNNAGITIKHGIKSIEEVDMDMFEQTWRANCGSAFLLTQLCIPEMEKKAWGRVIFCASVAGFIGGFVGPHYASSKSALHGLVHWLSQHYAHKGITVNAVAPALIADTTLLPGNPEDLAKSTPEKHTLFSRVVANFLGTEIPVGVLGRPEEIAETVVWMVKTGYLTNKVVGVDGGMFPQ